MRSLAASASLPDDVRVINPFVGGAFGSALRTWPHVTLAAMAARRAGRPVRLELTRRQLSTAIGFRPETRQRVALGADRDGRLTAMIHEVTGQTSTYEEFAEGTLSPAARTYACPDRRTRYGLVAMNVSTPCPMRGPGWATGLVGQEMAMDELAEALRLDPIELRLRNYAERDPMSGLPWSSKALRDCYRQGAERFGWHHRVPEPRAMRDGRELIGFGMATAIYHAARYPDLRLRHAVLGRDGHCALRHDRHGTGHLHVGDAGRCGHSRLTSGTGPVRAWRLDLPAGQGTWWLDHDGQCRVSGAGGLRGVEVENG